MKSARRKGERQEENGIARLSRPASRDRLPPNGYYSRTGGIIRAAISGDPAESRISRVR